MSIHINCRSTLHSLYIWLIFLLAALVTSCTPHITPQATTKYTQFPAEFPEEYYLQAAASGKKILVVDSSRSLVTIIVRRGGVLARLGHDHIVASHDVRGYVDQIANRADLYILLDRLTVDEPELRAEAGFTTQPSSDAIEGTRRNMQGKVLETDLFPFVLIHASHKATDHSKLKIAITLHGSTNSFEIPANIITLSDEIQISGIMSFNQTDFGIVPFSVLGGALKVEDHLELRFRIFAVSN